MNHMSKERYTRYERCFDLLAYIASATNVNRADLAERYQCSVRTIADDIALLKKLGFTIHYSKDSGYNLHGQLPILPFEQQQLLALFIGSQLLSLTPLEEEAQEGLKHLLASLPEERRKLVRELTDRICIAPGGKICSSEVLFSVYQAVSECRTLQVRYQAFSTDRTEVFCIEPYGIYLKDRFSSYLVGKRLGAASDVPRRFKLCRIIEVMALLGEFTYPRGFSIREEMKRGFWSGEHTYTVVLRFVPAVAQLVREREPAERIQTLPDGSLRVRKSVRHVKEALWEVLSYGANVEVEEPVQLRRLVRKSIAAMQQVYEQGLNLERRWQDE